MLIHIRNNGMEECTTWMMSWIFLKLTTKITDEVNWRCSVLVSLLLTLNTFSLWNIPNINIVLLFITLNIILPAVLVKSNDSETTVSKNYYCLFYKSQTIERLAVQKHCFLMEILWVLICSSQSSLKKLCTYWSQIEEYF